MDFCDIDLYCSATEVAASIYFREVHAS
jgi:hypothetical protein